MERDFDDGATQVYPYSHFFTLFYSSPNAVLYYLYAPPPSLRCRVSNACARLDLADADFRKNAHGIQRHEHAA